MRNHEINACEYNILQKRYLSQLVATANSNPEREISIFGKKQNVALNDFCICMVKAYKGISLQYSARKKKRENSGK